MILVVLLALSSNPLITQVRPQVPNEYQVKAAFVFNFAKFVEWPPDAFTDGGAPLVLGIIGDDPFGSAIEQTINGRTVNGRRLIIKRFRQSDNLRACHILLISSSERKQLTKIIDSINEASILTIGETPQFTQQGGVIKFVIQEDKLRFEINAAAAGRARLKISSKLLALSKGGRN
jgi:hypothetical protein